MPAQTLWTPSFYALCKLIQIWFKITLSKQVPYTLYLLMQLIGSFLIYLILYWCNERFTYDYIALVVATVKLLYHLKFEIIIKNNWFFWNLKLIEEALIYLIDNVLISSWGLECEVCTILNNFLPVAMWRILYARSD